MARVHPKCRDCRTDMQEGFVLDATQHSHAGAARWVEGPPEKSFWSGVRTKGRTMRVIVAFRCPQCGRLEHFATEEQRK